MQKQLITISFFIACFCCLMLPETFGQDVTIGATAYQVVSKVPLNASADYFQLKQKSAAGAVAQGYIKTGNTYSKTVFTQAEWKAFLEKGTISSLGKVSDVEIKLIKNKKPLKFQYIDKGTTKVIFLIQKDSVQFSEYPSAKFAALDNDGSGGKSDKVNACEAHCDYDYFKCVNDNVVNEGQCALWCLTCYDRCGSIAEFKGTTSNYSIAKFKLVVKQ